MKEINNKVYITPVSDQVDILCETILCQSGGYSATLEGMSETDYTFTF